MKIKHRVKGFSCKQVANGIMLSGAIIQYILMIYYIWKNWYGILNSDIAADLLLADTIAKEGGWLFTDNYYFTTEFHLLHTQIIQSILFRFTSNYRLVFVLSFAIITFLISLLSLTIVKKITDSNFYAFLSVLFLLAPSGEFYIYVFRAQAYSVYVLFIYLFLYLYLKLRERDETLTSSIYNYHLAILCVVSVLMGACGIRFFANLFIPLVLCELFSYRKKEWKAISDKVWLFLAIIVSAMVGLGIFIFYMQPSYGPFGVGSNIVLADKKAIQENILYLPIALMEVLGGELAVRYFDYLQNRNLTDGHYFNNWYDILCCR